MILGILSTSGTHFDYGVCTLCDWPFNAIRLYVRESMWCSVEHRESPTTPIVQRLPPITHDRFGLFRVRSPLLTESLLFSLPVGTEMFHFPTFPLSALYIQTEVTRSHKAPSGVSPFGNPRITARLSAPRGLSQIATSFFGSRCQGIHRLLLET